MSWLAPGPHHRWLEAEGDRLLAFSRASRHPRGGFAWLDDAGSPQLNRPVELWITCRMTHVFALGQLLGRPGCGPLADHGLLALHERFRDDDNGGWYADIGREGPTTRDKTAYEHAFVVLAAASATCVTGIEVSVSSCFASHSRRVVCTAIGVAPAFARNNLRS